MIPTHHPAICGMVCFKPQIRRIEFRISRIPPKTRGIAEFSDTRFEQFTIEDSDRTITIRVTHYGLTSKLFYPTGTIMKRIFKLLAAILLYSQTAFSQTDSTENKIKFKLGINYNTALNYYGRTDSLKSTGVFPLAELWFSKDFYVNAAPIFVNNSAQHFDYAGTVASIGYLHITDKWISNIYLLKPFYKESSQLVQSALQAQGSASISRLTKPINVTIGGDVKLSDKIDFGASAGLDHLIRKEMKNSSVLVIDPSFYTYAGTQNFTNTYYKKKTDFLLFPGNTEQVTENVQKFNVLAYEFSIPVVYARGNWMVLLTPYYVLPQNLVTVLNRPDLSERGQNMFYATAGLKYSF